jgi:hypothetical protein
MACESEQMFSVALPRSAWTAPRKLEPQ